MKKLISLLLLCSFYCVPVSVPGAGDVPAVCGKEQKTENWKKLFGNNLFDADGKKVPVGKAIKKKYVGIYGSASWCGPCRMFTPKLIEFYKKNKNKIDIVLIGFHWTQEDVCSYMKKYNMPWAGTYRTENVEKFIERHNIPGIPDLRIFTHGGEQVIADAYDLNALQKFLDEN
ncbi:MAG: hypothetical protein E7037_01260 [Verrucomicrobia bacterium]|nr:hypothetical protein [Verrucomicrobiota bacterium]